MNAYPPYDPNAGPKAPRAKIFCDGRYRSVTFAPGLSVRDSGVGISLFKRGGPGGQLYYIPVPCQQMLCLYVTHVDASGNHHAPVRFSHS